MQRLDRVRERCSHGSRVNDHLELFALAIRPANRPDDLKLGVSQDWAEWIEPIKNALKVGFNPDGSSGFLDPEFQDFIAGDERLELAGDLVQLEVG